MNLTDMPMILGGTQTTKPLANGDYVEHIRNGSGGRVLYLNEAQDHAYVVWVKRKRHSWVPVISLNLSTKRAIEIEMGMFPYALTTYNKRYLRGENQEN